MCKWSNFLLTSFVCIVSYLWVCYLLSETPALDLQVCHESERMIDRKRNEVFWRKITILCSVETLCVCVCVCESLKLQLTDRSWISKSCLSCVKLSRASTVKGCLGLIWPHTPEGIWSCFSLKLFSQKLNTLNSLYKMWSRCDYRCKKATYWWSFQEENWWVLILGATEERKHAMRSLSLSDTQVAKRLITYQQCSLTGAKACPSEQKSCLQSTIAAEVNLIQTWVQTGKIQRMLSVRYDRVLGLSSSLQYFNKL